MKLKAAGGGTTRLLALSYPGTSKQINHALAMLRDQRGVDAALQSLKLRTAPTKHEEMSRIAQPTQLLGAGASRSATVKLLHTQEQTLRAR